MVYAQIAEGLGLQDLADRFRNAAFRILYRRRYNLVEKTDQAY